MSIPRPIYVLMLFLIAGLLAAASPARAERAKNYSNEQLKLLFSGTKVEATGEALCRTFPAPGDLSLKFKFATDGTFLSQIGDPEARSGRDSNDKMNFGQVAKLSNHTATNELFVADGYQNKRVVVLDATTGEFKRTWGAYGNPPDDAEFSSMTRWNNANGTPPPPQFQGPVHCAEPSLDGLVYVCDRGADRVQVFTLDGEYVQEVQFAPNTRSQGSTWDIAFSPDAAQTYLYLADGQNMKVYIILRETMEVLTSFGDGGRQPGLFFAVHSLDTDSDGNIYTTETYEGSRLQKFVYLGIGPIPSEDQGALWPGQTNTYGNSQNSGM